MDDEASAVEADRAGALALRVSSLRDEIELLSRRIDTTLGSAVVITALFVVGGLFMEQTATLWFLGALWLFFIGRLALINRNTENKRRLKESELATLTAGPGAPALPNGV